MKVKKPNKLTKNEKLYISSFKTHEESQCVGEHCCIHNPSKHHMRKWPMNWRADKGVMERICPHGIGHPDLDDAAYNVRIGKDYLNVHGCDGCCCEPKKKKQRIHEKTNYTREKF